MGRRFEVERRRDPYYRAAQREGLRSRAAYKLAHLDDRFHFLRPGRRVLDLGAAPGGWALVAASRVGRTGHVLAIDPRRVEPIPGVEVLRNHAESDQVLARLKREQFDVVVSDMSPRISGAYSTDHARSVELGRLVLSLARACLRPGGAAVAKVFQGDMMEDLGTEWERSFRRVVTTKPPASRGPSSEMYLVGLGFTRMAGVEP